MCKYIFVDFCVPCKHHMWGDECLALSMALQHHSIFSNIFSWFC